MSRRRFNVILLRKLRGSSREGVLGTVAFWSDGAHSLGGGGGGGGTIFLMRIANVFLGIGAFPDGGARKLCNKRKVGGCSLGLGFLNKAVRETGKFSFSWGS